MNTGSLYTVSMFSMYTHCWSLPFPNFEVNEVKRVRLVLITDIVHSQLSFQVSVLQEKMLHICDRRLYAERANCLSIISS